MTLVVRLTTFHLASRLPSLIGGVKVRIIEASVTVTCHDGTTYYGAHRFAATLLDRRVGPGSAPGGSNPRSAGGTAGQLIHG